MHRLSQVRLHKKNGYLRTYRYITRVSVKLLTTAIVVSYVLQSRI